MTVAIGLIFGVVVGVIAAPTLAYIVDGIVRERELHQKPTAWLFGLLGGSTVLVGPASAFFDARAALAWFVIGWAVLVIPVGIVSWVRFAFGHVRPNGVVSPD